MRDGKTEDSAHHKEEGSVILFVNCCVSSPLRWHAGPGLPIMHCFVLFLNLVPPMSGSDFMISGRFLSDCVTVDQQWTNFQLQTSQITNQPTTFKQTRNQTFLFYFIFFLAVETSAFKILREKSAIIVQIFVREIQDTVVYAQVWKCSRTFFLPV